jgi:poly(A)-specific ribonuclease
MFPPADNRVTKEVVMNPSSIAFLNQHNMNFNLWSKQGVSYVTGDVADDMLARFQEKQSEKKEQAESNSSSPGKEQAARRRVELRRTEDINFHARTMASLREWLDTAQRPVPLDLPLGLHGPEDVSEGTAFLLPPANSFLRRALYEAIELEYPTLVTESAGSQHPNQIRVLRLNPEEKKIREQRVLKEDWEDLIVNRIGMWRIFSALSLTCQGLQIPFDSFTFAENVNGVNWERSNSDGELEKLETVGRRIPIIVHNGLMDLLFLCTHFISHELPPTYAEAKALIHNYFPVIYDTKLLSTECTPASLWNNFTTLENLFQKVISENPDMANAIDLVSDLDEINEFGNLAGNEEQMHEAAYDAYMTGAVYTGLCRLITSRAHYFHDTPSGPPDVGGTQVGSLFHLVLDENDEYVTTVFGCNKLYLMQSVYIIDLAGSQDPLNRGMIAKSLFRISDCDPTATTRAIAQCISGLLDTRLERVTYEIIWVDSSTFLVGAIRESTSSILPSAVQQPADNSALSEEAILREHGDIIFRALRNRFKVETIERWDDYIHKIRRAETAVGSSNRGLLARASHFFWSALGWSTDDGGGKGKKRESQSDSSSPTAKRRRVI